MPDTATQEEPREQEEPRWYKVLDTLNRNPVSFHRHKRDARQERDRLNREYHTRTPSKRDENAARYEPEQEFNLRYLTFRGPDHPHGETFLITK